MQSSVNGPFPVDPISVAVPVPPLRPYWNTGNPEALEDVQSYSSRDTLWLKEFFSLRDWSFKYTEVQ